MNERELWYKLKMIAAMTILVWMLMLLAVYFMTPWLDQLDKMTPQEFLLSLFAWVSPVVAGILAYRWAGPSVAVIIAAILGIAFWIL